VAKVEDPKVMINRRRTRLGAVLVGAALLTWAAAGLSACSAGQITQTDTQVAAVPGVNVNSADGQIGLRNGLIVYAGKYPPNTTIPLDLRLVNDSTQAARLTGAVTADGNGQVVLVGGASSSPTPSPAAPSPSSSASPAGSASPSGSTPASPSAAPSPTPVGSAQLNVALPVGQIVILSSSLDGAGYLAITGRSSELLPGQTVGVTLTFTYADGKTPATTLSANVPVGTPLSPPTQEPPASAGE
jgi:hypothetical protein